MTLTVGSLFSGIGGLDLGLERAGMRVIWQSEIDPYACRVLQKHWPEVPNHGDIKQIDWDTIERPNVICGGYPCQPFSQAGKRKGETDPRHLWPWVREAISRLRPDYAILENVRGHLSRGGVSVIGDLASIGYDAEWRIVSAASVGANHRRDRIIIVAYPSSVGRLDSGTEINSTEAGEPSQRESGQCCADVAYPNDAGSRTSRSDIDGDGQTFEQERQNKPQRGISGCGELVADDGCKRYGEHGFPSDVGQENQRRVYHGGRQEGYVGWQWWQTEPDVGRVANKVPNRVDRLRGLGNAVVPQVAEVKPRLVMEHASIAR